MFIMKNLYLLLMAMAMAVTTGLHSAQLYLQPSGGGTPIALSRDAALLSATIRNILEDCKLADGEPVPTPNISREQLEAIVPLLEYVCALHNAYEAHTINLRQFFDKCAIAIKIAVDRTVPVTEPTAPVAKLTKRAIALWRAIGLYLDVDVIKAPFAHYVCRQIRSIGRDAMSAIIKNYHDKINDGDSELPPLLAKYWYLNYGTKNADCFKRTDDYINVPWSAAYGFSVEELAAFGKITQENIITEENADGILAVNLVHMKINDITNIGNILTDLHINNTEILYLYNNQITAIAPGTFTGLANLQHLFLGNNQIAAIAPGAFTGLANLQHLFLGNNQIATIAPGAFTGLVNLQTLDLSNNQITAIAPGTFTGLANLRALNLFHNQITAIAPGTFTGLANLRVLYLYGNQISVIVPGTFTGLVNLQVLNLFHNQIAAIAPGAFTGLANLQHLYLRNNQISVIVPGTFTGLANLEYLSLSNNKIAAIAPGTFTGLANLQRLDLFNNQIAAIAPGAFTGLANLQGLYLFNNQITAIAPAQRGIWGVPATTIIF